MGENKDKPEKIVPIGQKLRIINNQIGRYFSNCWKKTGVDLTRMQCATIHYLKKHQEDEVFQKDLEAEFSISGATATNILKLMEKEEIILRQPLERDGRLKRIGLTEKGYCLDAKARENIERLEEAMRKNLTEEEIAIFSNVLDKITQNIVDLVEKDAK